jgi:hypothetical protein
MRQRVVRDLASIGLNQQRDLGKGVERDAHRQQNVRRQSGREQGIEIGGEEAGILEYAEHQQIAADAGREYGQSQPGARLLRDQQQPYDVVERDRDKQQRHELPVTERVEGDRRHHQPDHRPSIAVAAGREISEQDGRQEQENERIGIENHVAFSAAPRSLAIHAGRPNPCATGAGAALLEIRRVRTDIRAAAKHAQRPNED